MAVKSIFKQDVANSLILSLYLLLCFFLYYTSSELVRTFAHSIIFTLSFLPAFLQKTPIHLIIKCLLLFGIAVIIALFRQDVSISLIYVLVAPIFAFWIYKNRFDLRILFLQFLFVAGYFLIYFFLRGTLDNAIAAASRNFISAILLFNTAILTLIIFRQTTHVNIIPSILTMIICINAVGRGGIIASIGLFLVVIFWKLNDRFSKSAKIVTIISIIIALVFFNLILEYLGNFEQFSRFQERGIDDYSRLTLREEYLNNINTRTFLTGYNYHANYLFKSFRDNPHNSYIRLHSNMGISAIVIVILLLYSVLKFIKKNIFMLGILLVLLARAWTDIIVFNNFYDFVIWYFIFVASQDKYLLNDDQY